MGLADAWLRAEAAHQQPFSLPYYLGVSAGLYVTWIVFATAGALVRPMAGDIEVYGFDMAFPAVFLVLLRGMWKGARAARPCLVSLVVAAMTYLLVPGAWYVGAGALSGLAAAYLGAEEK